MSVNIQKGDKIFQYIKERNNYKEVWNTTLEMNHVELGQITGVFKIKSIKPCQEKEM